MVSDNVFIEQQTFAYVDFSYKLDMGESQLYLGLKGGGNFYKADPSLLSSYTGGDPTPRSRRSRQLATMLHRSPTTLAVADVSSMTVQASASGRYATTASSSDHGSCPGRPIRTRCQAPTRCTAGPRCRRRGTAKPGFRR